MRFSQRKTKREMAISAEMVDHAAASVLMSADDACLTEEQRVRLQWLGRQLREIAGSLFEKSLPSDRSLFETESPVLQAPAQHGQRRFTWR